MGKLAKLQSMKSKKFARKPSAANMKQSNEGENSPKAIDKDNALFIAMSYELKNEGNRLFQKRDYEGAILKYEKAVKLLPRNHIDVSHLRSNMAACYMQMGINEYPRAIHECNLALEVTPKYSKALLKRSRCYEALNRLNLAYRDVTIVLEMEPNNIMAVEIYEKLKQIMQEKGIGEEEMALDSIPVPEYLDPIFASRQALILKEKLLKKKLKKMQSRKVWMKGEGEKDGTQDEDRNLEITPHAPRKENKFKVLAEDKKPEPEVDAATSEKSFEETAEDEKPVLKVDAPTGENKFEEETEDKKAKLKVNARPAENKFEKAEEKKAELKVDATRNGNKFEEEPEDKIYDRKAEDKLVVEEQITSTAEKRAQRTVKLVFGEDIRWAQIPVNCSILKLREAIVDRFPGLKGVLIKYRDQEGDLVTIMATEELRWAEDTAAHGSLRLYLVEVNPDKDPLYEKLNRKEDGHGLGMKKHMKMESGNLGRNMDHLNRPVCVEDWIIQFADLFKNYVGFDPDSYLDLNELGMKLYSEGLEEVTTSEEAQEYLSLASDKFQEMAALALFNWGNVHMSRARKRVYFSEDASRESVLQQVKIAYDWAQKEYSEAGKKYEEALHIMPNFYEAILALGQEQFEQAKLSWYYAVGNNVDLESWPCTEVLELYNKAEENLERGMLMWEDTEELRLQKLQSQNKVKGLMQKMKLVDMFKDMSEHETVEQAASMRSQINVLWGTILYERSMMEFKLGLPVWEECLEVAVEKFELAGASPTDIAVMMKNHCSNNTSSEGLGFNIDEIVQAWDEMHQAKRWQSGISSFRLEPVLRRRVSKLYYDLKHA